jgi:hypothetical protein
MRGFGLCGEHGSYFGAANSLAKLQCDRPVTSKAKGSNVIEVAFATPFCYRQNMIGIPQTFADSGFESPVTHQGFASSTAGPLEFAVLPDRVYTTVSAPSPVTLENMFAHIPRLRTQLPLVHAILRTEREAARRHFQRAPSA